MDDRRAVLSIIEIVRLARLPRLGESAL